MYPSTSPAPGRGCVFAAALLCAGACGAADAPQPTPRLGVTHEYAGRLMGIDCPTWTVTALTADGGSLATCGEHRLETAGAHDGNALHVTDATGRKLVELFPMFCAQGSNVRPRMASVFFTV